MTLTINSTVTLRSGGVMPVLGFGVYQSTAANASSTSALHSGYRHIDSARIYRNEAEVCAAVKAWKSIGGNDSEAVWLTSKVSEAYVARSGLLTHVEIGHLGDWQRARNDQDRSRSGGQQRQSRGRRVDLGALSSDGAQQKRR
jgi:hypothetical protein